MHDADNHSCYIDHRNHTLKCSLYPKGSHYLHRIIIPLTTKLLLNLKPDIVDELILTSL